MNFRRVALLVPYNKELVLLQDRRNKIKLNKVDYGFFGGGIEEGETVEQALAREIREELSIDVKILKDLRFFKQYYYESKKPNISRELHVFICQMPKLETLKINEGGGEIFSIRKAIALNISNMDKKILIELQSYLKP
jgi:8-oxo-dGTP pyrophosphatase MutT (NUDIX family)